MRIFHSGKGQMLAFFVPGFLLGIIFVNLIVKKYMTETGIFSDLFLSQFTSVQIDIRSYLPYLLRLRIVPLILLAAALLWFGVLWWGSRKWFGRQVSSK